jgi:predicted AlkP superfamily pyrophosphatase or phosphodiesterase
MMKNVLLFLAAFLLKPLLFSQDRNVPPEKPKLVISIIVSEMRYDYINRYWNNFAADGFKKLFSNGSIYINAHHDYLIAESGPGYASVATGAYPDVHGIVSNYWFERLKNTVSFCIEDDKMKSIGGSYEGGKFSPSRMLALTTSDQLKISSSFKSKVISVSLDPVASVISGGHIADAAYWYDTSSGKWVSSTFYMNDIPAWLQEFNAKDLPNTYLTRIWEPLLPLENYKNLNRNGVDKQAGLGGVKSFPYNLEDISSLKRKQVNYAILRQTPFGNTFTKDLAIASIINENLGKGEQTDWLSVGFSANSYIGKNFSSWSPEMEDTYIRLDQDIAHFLDFIDETLGMKNVLIYLTAENAIANEPSFMLEHRLPSGYFNYNSALSLLRTYLNVVYGTGDWVKYYYSQQIFLNRDLIDNSRLSHEEFQNRVAGFMVQFEGVSNALTSENLMQNNYTHGVFEKMQKTFNQKRSGDVILGLTPGWVETSTERQGSSSLRYDSHVPLIFYGWRTGRSVVSRNVSLTSITPTISVLLNMSRPASAQGEVLMELVK